MNLNSMCPAANACCQNTKSLTSTRYLPKYHHTDTEMIPLQKSKTSGNRNGIIDDRTRNFKLVFLNNKSCDNV